MTDAPFRILYYYPRQQMDTGSPHALVAVIDSLDRASFAPVFLSKAEGALTKTLRKHDTEIIDGSADSVTPRALRGSITAVRRQMRLLRDAKIDVIHLHEEGWNYDLLVAAVLRRIPVVMHVHNPVVAERRNIDWPIASRVVFVSDAHRASTKHLERIESKSVVIYNSIDIDRFANGRPIREALGIAPNDVVIGTVAQLAHRKGLDILVETAARMLPENPHLLFLIAGPPALGEKAFSEKLAARVADPALAGRVRLLGSRSDVPDFLASCDVFFLPTRAEPMGMAVVEAMAARLPVVASRVGGIPEVIPAPELGSLVAPLTPDAFVAAIDRVLALPDRGRAMGVAAAASARARFDRPVIAGQWCALYRELGQRRRASRA